MSTIRESAGRPEASTSATIWHQLGLLFLSLYAVATLAPGGANWGIHALGYFPLWVRIAGLTCSAALLYPPFQEPVVRSLRFALQPLMQRSLRGRLLLLALGSGAFAVFYAFSIRTDIYGDARTILHWDAGNNKRFISGGLTQIFDLQLLANKEALTLLLHRSVAHLFAIPIAQAYRIVSSLSGALSLVLWVLFVRRAFVGSRWGPLLIALGCLIGSNQIFFGHVETYPFASLTSLALLLTGLLALENNRYLWAMPFLSLLALKAHPALLYFIPALLFLLAYRLALRFPTLLSLLTWKRLAFVLVIPSLVAGAALYVFYFKSYNEPHAGIGREFAHAFLPIIPARPPLDRYSLQSLNHLRDLANVLLLIGTPVMVGLIGLLLSARKTIAWTHPRVVFASLGFSYPLVFFLVLNPALAMPRDWDLYALMGPPLLVFFAALLAHSDDSTQAAPVHGTTLAFAVFAVAFFGLNASPTGLSTRLENVGEHVFRTYHAGASYIINVAQGMEPDTARALARRIATIERLTPYRTGEDDEYTHLISKVAGIYLERGDLHSGVRWMERAVAVSPQDDNLTLYLADYYLRAQRTEDAQRRVGALLLRSPRNLQALLLAAVAAAQKQHFVESLAYLERAQAVTPENRDIASWIENARRNLARRKP